MEEHPSALTQRKAGALITGCAGSDRQRYVHPIRLLIARHNPPVLVLAFSASDEESGKGALYELKNLAADAVSRGFVRQSVWQLEAERDSWAAGTR